MISEIKVSQEDFEAELFVKTVYDDESEMRTDSWTVFARKGKVSVIHTEGCMFFNDHGTPDEYYRKTLSSIVRVFKAMFPSWREY